MKRIALLQGLLAALLGAARAEAAETPDYRVDRRRYSVSTINCHGSSCEPAFPRPTESLFQLRPQGAETAGGIDVDTLRKWVAAEAPAPAPAPAVPPAEAPAAEEPPFFMPPNVQPFRQSTVACHGAAAPDCSAGFGQPSAGEWSIERFITPSGGASEARPEPELKEEEAAAVRRFIDGLAGPETPAQDNPAAAPAAAPPATKPAGDKKQAELEKVRGEIAALRKEMSRRGSGGTFDGSRELAQARGDLGRTRDQLRDALRRIESLETRQRREVMDAVPVSRRRARSDREPGAPAAAAAGAAKETGGGSVIGGIGIAAGAAVLGLGLLGPIGLIGGLLLGVGIGFATGMFG